jgi:hypothetical protein
MSPCHHVTTSPCHHVRRFVIRIWFVSMKEKLNFLFSCEKSPSCAHAALLLRFLYHTQLEKHTRYDSFKRVINSSQRQLPAQNTTNTRDEIRTRNLSNRQAIYLRLRPHGHRDRRKFISLVVTSNTTIDCSGNDDVFLCLKGYQKRKLNFHVTQLTSCCSINL